MLIKTCLNETYSEFCIRNKLSNGFFYPEWSETRDTHIITIALIFALEYSIRNGQENQDRMELNVIHHVLVYADYVNFFSRNILQRRRETLVRVCVSPPESRTEIQCSDTS